jgi:hypothetical protein
VDPESLRRQAEPRQQVNPLPYHPIRGLVCLFIPSIGHLATKMQTVIVGLTPEPAQFQGRGDQMGRILAIYLG